MRGPCRWRANAVSAQARLRARCRWHAGAGRAALNFGVTAVGPTTCKELRWQRVAGATPTLRDVGFETPFGVGIINLLGFLLA